VNPCLKCKIRVEDICKLCAHNYPRIGARLMSLAELTELIEKCRYSPISLDEIEGYIDEDDQLYPKGGQNETM